MKPRLSALQDIDPLAVPLPHGTEVGTRVDRWLGEGPEARKVPQGSVGRVVALHGEAGIDVALVGVGVLRYRREELVPRKLGQLRYAIHRDAAWTALRGNAVLLSTVGSRAWGLSHEGSDTDLRGVFALPFPWTQGLVQPPADLISADGSTTLWALDKAVRQALSADPNTLEMLFVEEARAIDPLGEELLRHREAFVSREIYGSFGRYALSQLHRLQSGLRLAEHRAVLLDWLRAEPGLDLDQVATRLALHAPAEGRRPGEHRAHCKDYIKQVYSSLYDQGLLSARDWSAFVTFARERSADFDLPRTLRPKNAYNLLRLIWTAIRWMETGRAQLRVEGPLRDQLLAIKNGEVELEAVLVQAEALTPRLEAARHEPHLPLGPDLDRIDGLLRRTGDEVARRWLDQAPGPWGAEAPPPPTPPQG
jgi:hypothetical protein